MRSICLVIAIAVPTVGLVGCGGHEFPEFRRPPDDEEPPTPKAQATPAKAAKSPPDSATAAKQASDKTPAPAKEPATEVLAKKASAKEAVAKELIPLGLGKASRPVRASRPPDDSLAPRPAAIRKLRSLAKALEAYRTQHDRYPDQSAGRLSWRVALLPFLGQEELFQKFRHNEPWDSPHNRPLLKEIPEVFQSPERRDERTNFLLITGPGTAHAGKEGLSEKACPDGLHNTVLLAEVADHLAKPWTQPEDYVFKRADVQHDLFSLRQDCCFVVLGGGLEVRRLPANVADGDLLALLSPAGREGRSSLEVTANANAEIDAALVAELERNPPRRFAEAPAAPKDARLPVPDEKALAAAVATAKELYRSGYESAKKRGDKRAFAKHLLAQADKVATDPVGMYVLLGDARDIAASAGDIETALAAATKLGATFRADSVPMKLKVLEQAAPALDSLAEAGTLFSKSMELETELLARDDFDAAKRALALAMNAARRSGRRDVVDQVTARTEELEELRRAFDRVTGAFLTVIRSRDDPAASAIVGRYVCLVKHDWAAGLPLLSRGDDERLRELAVADLRQPTSADGQVALADRWWEWSEKLSPTHQPNSVERRSARGRAAHWYKQALPALPASLASERAKQRIAEAEKNPKLTGSSAKAANASSR
jgi:hypothetical protein